MNTLEANTNNTRAELQAWLTDLLPLIRRANHLLRAEREVEHHYDGTSAAKDNRWVIGKYLLIFVTFWVPIQFLGPFSVALNGLAISMFADLSIIPHVAMTNEFVAAVAAFGPLALSIGMTALIYLFRRKGLRTVRKNLEAEFGQRSPEDLGVCKVHLQVIRAALDEARSNLLAHSAEKFPTDYFTDEVVEFCLDQVRDNRASTLDDALDLYCAEQDKCLKNDKKMALSIAEKRQAQASMIRQLIQGKEALITSSARAPQPNAVEKLDGWQD